MKYQSFAWVLIVGWVALSTCTASIAQVATVNQVAPRATYCGSGLTEPLVPDQLLGCNMSDACKSHDACYAICEQGQPKAQTAYCQLSELHPDRAASKRKCDTQLKDDIIHDNPDNAICARIGEIYRLFVRGFGQGPFNGKLAPETMRLIVTESATPAEAATKLTTMLGLASREVIDLDATWVQSKTLVIPTKKSIAPSPLIKNGVIEFRKGDSLLDLKNLQRNSR